MQNVASSGQLVWLQSLSRSRSPVGILVCARQGFWDRGWGRVSLRFVRPLISRQLWLWHGIWSEERIWGLLPPWAVGAGWCLVRCFDAIFVATCSMGDFSVLVEISPFGCESEDFSSAVCLSSGKCVTVLVTVVRVMACLFMVLSEIML